MKEKRRSNTIRNFKSANRRLIQVSLLSREFQRLSRQCTLVSEQYTVVSATITKEYLNETSIETKNYSESICTCAIGKVQKKFLKFKKFGYYFWFLAI